MTRVRQILSRGYIAFIAVLVFETGSSFGDTDFNIREFPEKLINKWWQSCHYFLIFEHN